MKQNLTKKQQKDLVKSVFEDFKRRQEEKKLYEKKWQQNINYLIGNQNSYMSLDGIVCETQSKFFWQENKVFNHIAPIIETRLARLSEVKPAMIVLPASSQDDDISNAKVCKDILESVSSKINLSKIVSDATTWSEVCGTSFYKVVWNNQKGQTIGIGDDGAKIYEGDVDVLVCSPFEIYPDSNLCSSLEDAKSIIHAKSYDVETIFDVWGVKVRGGDVDSYSLSQSGGLLSSFSKQTKHNHALVLEKYERPSKRYPDGRLIIVCEDELLYYGKLPYKNMLGGERGFPFVRQISIKQPTQFWGLSVVDRLIPIQNAYNMVKNRKHEFMNRLSMGVLAVEDGSVDVESLEEDGLAPGKVLVYRQGSSVPKVLCDDAVPSSFNDEEKSLIEEFSNVGGISDIFDFKNKLSFQNMSGTALNLLMEQQYSRISAVGENIKFAVMQIAEEILRLYKQFVVGKRVSRIVSNNGEANFFYWDKGSISSDEVVFDVQAENLRSLSQKRNILLELLDKGIFSDESGRINGEMKLKLLDALGFGLWEDSLDNNALQIQKAKRENIELLAKSISPKVLEIHDHKLHINAHIAFMLSKDFEKACTENNDLESLMLNHIKEHQKYLDKMANKGE